MVALARNDISIVNIDGSESYIRKGDEVYINFIYIDEEGNELALISNEFSLGVSVFANYLDIIGLH